jgi:transcription elongation factor/antiterminator RfaH
LRIQQWREIVALTSGVDELRWYVIQTHPKQENRVEKNLATLAVSTFNPKIKKCRLNQFTGKPSYVSSPLFPSYIFARFRIRELYHTVSYTRGVHRLVSFDDFPAPIEDHLIELIQSRIGSDGYVVIGSTPVQESLQPGDEVVIRDGPLKDFSGILEREMAGGERVRILLQTIGYQAHVELESNLVVKVKNSGGN